MAPPLATGCPAGVLAESETRMGMEQGLAEGTALPPEPPSAHRSPPKTHHGDDGGDHGTAVATPAQDGSLLTVGVFRLASVGEQSRMSGSGRKKDRTRTRE